MTGIDEPALVRTLLERYGRSYATEAGIRLADRPAPLYQLLVLATLLSARISADIAVAAARELFAAGYCTPSAMRAASWPDRVNALGRGHYRRFDERTATMLGQAADLLIDRWHGDLRTLHAQAQEDVPGLASLLTDFPGIGPAGASIFLREVQVVWPDVAPYCDHRVLESAARLGLPRDCGKLARLAGSPKELAGLSAALIRVSRSARAASEVTAAASARTRAVGAAAS
jgi:endonuclease III